MRIPWRKSFLARIPKTDIMSLLFQLINEEAGRTMILISESSNSATSHRNAIFRGSSPMYLTLR